MKLATLEKRLNGEEYLKITFPFSFLEVDRVKTLPERKYHGEASPKYWTCPHTQDNLQKLTAWGYTLDLKGAPTPEIHIEEIQPISIPSSKKTLYPYQNIGVAFIEKKNGRALIADDMGLGKTAQALSWLQLHPEKRIAIIVVPATLKINWERECHLWVTNPRPQILSGTNTDKKITGDIIIINYDILHAWVDTLKELSPKVIVLDEVHYAKTSSSRRTKAVKKLCKGIPHVIAMSGTPIENRPVEIFNAINIVDDNIFPSFYTFAHRFCGAKRSGFAKNGWDFNGASNTKELHRILTSTIMLRRKKIDVLTELPPKTFAYVPLEITNRKEYEKAKADIISWIWEQKGREAADRASNAEAFARFEGLKQLAVKGKMDQILDWIEDVIQTNTKLIVFANHKHVIDRVMEEFQNVAVKIDGSVSQAQRQTAVDAFQNDPKTLLFVGNTKAAGVGITLTAASNVAFIEFPWNPGAIAQASDRAHRIGQKDNVTIHYLLAVDTIEEEIAHIIDEKMKVLDAVLDGVDSDSDTLITELIKKYGQINDVKK